MRSKKINFIGSSLLLSLFLLAGCTHSLHISHVSDFSPTYSTYQKGELVKSRSEQFVILGFVTDTDYVDNAFQKLLKSCPGGAIQGITTQNATDHGFFSWTNTVEIQGLCVK